MFAESVDRYHGSKEVNDNRTDKMPLPNKGSVDVETVNCWYWLRAEQSFNVGHAPEILIDRGNCPSSCWRRSLHSLFMFVKSWKDQNYPSIVNEMFFDWQKQKKTFKISTKHQNIKRIWYEIMKYIFMFNFRNFTPLAIYVSP